MGLKRCYNKYMRKRPAIVLIMALLLVFLTGFFICQSTFAADSSRGVVETVFFGNLDDDGKGCGVYTVVNLVIDIITIGIGILSVASIIAMGIKYMTAGGDEEQAKKAKYRLLQIVVGLLAYALLYVGVQWLLPGGKFDTSQKCDTITNEQLAALKAKEEKAKAGSDSGSVSSSGLDSGSGSGSGSSSSSGEKSSDEKSESYKKCMKNAAKVVRDKICDIKKPAERIAKTAKLLAGSSGSPSAIYKQAMKETQSNANGGCEKLGKACNTYVATVLLASGVDPKVPKGNNKSGNNTRVLYDHFLSSSKWKKVGTKPTKSREGDVVVKPRPNGHVTITVKNKSGKLVTAHASNCAYNEKTKTFNYSTGFYPVISGSIYTSYSGTATVFRYVGD